MSQPAVNPEVEAAKAKQFAGRPLTPGEEVLIAIDESNKAAHESVARGLTKANRIADIQRVKHLTGENM